ncbi:MAG: hypothetical protein SVO01_00885 [Thermotogota bacterium]|nr:hypothetical protein [Thermotogota bacterium]
MKNIWFYRTKIGSILKKEELAIFFIYVLLSIFNLRGILFTNNRMGFNHDWDFPYSIYEFKVYCNQAFYIWSEHNLGRPMMYPAQYLLKYFLTPFSYLGLDGLIAIKLLLLFMFIFSGYFMYLLLRKSFKLGPVPSIVSGIFYMTTPVFFNKIVAGHFLYLIGYTLSPLIMFYFKKYLDDDETKYLVLTGLLISLASIQVQFAIMLLVLLLFYNILLYRVEMNKTLKISVFLIAIILLIHSFWIITSVSNFLGLVETVKTASNVECLKSWNTSIINAFMLVGYRSHHFLAALNNYEYKSIYNICSFLLLLLIFSSLLIRKHRVPLFFGMVSIITLIFTTALSDPFGGLVSFLYSNFPVFNLFREVYHFTVLISFSYSIMLAYTINSICNFKKIKFLRFISVILVLFIIMFNNPFVYTGDFNGQVQTYKFNNPDLSLLDEYQEFDEDYRVLYLPMIQPFKYDNLTYTGIDPIISYSKKPTLGNYVNSEFIRSLSLNIHSPSKNIDASLIMLSIKYIFFRNEYQSMLPHYLDQGKYKVGDEWHDIRPIWTNENLLKTLVNQKGLILLDNNTNVIVFENRNVLPHIYPTTDATYIDGNLSTLASLYLVKDFNIKQAFFFSDLNKKDDFIMENANTFVVYGKERGGAEHIKAVYNYSDYQDFENGLGDWLVEKTPIDVVLLTEKDNYSGKFSAEISSGEHSNTRIYKDFEYDGESQIGIDLWMNIVEREEPTGAYVYIRGYDRNGIEKARIIYYTYDNWDHKTSTPEENSQTFYVVKTDLGDPPYNTWVNVNRNSRGDFDEEFPHVWDELDITKIRVDLYCWGDGAITARYDDVKVSGILNDPISFIRSDFEVYTSMEGKYQGYKVTDQANEDQEVKTNNLKLSTGSNIAPIETNGSDYQSFEDGLGDWSVDVSSGDVAHLTGKDWNSGDVSVEMGLDGLGSSTHVYKDFKYYGKSPININIWMKIVERKEPAGAFVYVRGYDTNGTEKVHIVYYTYDNWDYGTSTPEENNQTFYVVKTDLGDPPYNIWINVNRDPREDFEEAFPHIWGELNLTRLRVDLYCWGDGAITARYDDVKVSGVLSDFDILLVESPEINNLNITAPSNDTYNIFAHIKTTSQNHTIPINLAVEAPRLINRMESSNPSFHPYDCTYTPSISDGTLKITTFFDGPSEEREYMEVKELIREISVNEYQNVSISCKVDDSDVQAIKMGFKVKNETGTVTTIWKRLEPSEEWHTYEINLYDRILRTYPDEAYTLLEITIVPSKMWGLDCSGDKRGGYTYYIKDLGVSKSKTTTEYPIVESNIGGETFKTEVDAPSFEWIKIGETYLEEGEHTVTWNVAGGGDVEIDNIRAIPKGQLFDPKDYSDEPSIVFQKINPTKYKVHVSTNEPFFLVFSESYHPQWKAYLDKRSFEFNDIIASYDNVEVKEAGHEMKFTPGDISYLFADPVSDDKHFIVNGYANSWYIEETGEYDLTLYFLPQSLFYLGLLISGGTLIGCIGYLLRDWRRKDE